MRVTICKMCIRDRYKEKLRLRSYGRCMEEMCIRDRDWRDSGDRKQLYAAGGYL